MVLPSNISYGTIVGQFLAIGQDSTDSDDLAEGIPLQGSITFTPNVPYFKDIAGMPNAVTLFKTTITCYLDSEGYLSELIGPDTYRRGVKLVATDDPDLNPVDWTWTVNYFFKDVNGQRIDAPASHSITVPTNSTQDLTEISPVIASPGNAILRGPSGDIHISGSVATSSNLPTTGNINGDAFVTLNTGHLWVWITDDDAWLDCGPIVGPVGPTGPQGPRGIGMPEIDGNIGDILRKASTSTTEWFTPEKVSVKDFGAVGDGVTDDTAAFQSSIGGVRRVPAGTYIINTVTINTNTTFLCDPGVIFKRKDGVATSSGGWSGSAMFEMTAAGLTVRFSDFTYDGNNANQTTTEPDGIFLKMTPPVGYSSAQTNIHIDRGRFINGTLGYLLIRGDDVQKRYETYAYLNDCIFQDTVKGKGTGDPSTPTAVGYAPTYVMVMDYVRLRTKNFRAEYAGTLSTGEYAPCALNGTYYGSVYANSGESFVYMDGTTSLTGVGRAIRKYDDSAFTNNAVGGIDMYGNAETLYIENLYAKDTQFTAVRAKGSLKNFTIGSAALTNCWRGIQVGASSTGACETVIKLGNVNCYGGTTPQIEFVGTSTSDRLRSVTMESAFILGTFTNPEGLSSQGLVRFRNIERVVANSINISTALAYGVETYDINYVYLEDINTDGGITGIYHSGTTSGYVYKLDGFSVSNTSGAGVNLSSNPKKIMVDEGRTLNTVDYGVFSNNTTSEVIIRSVEVDTVTGNSRAFYTAGGNASFIGNKSNATTHIWPSTGLRKRERDNSWNPAESFGTAAPTTGTYSVGDVVKNTTPAAGGTYGWICTTAGTPGTWKILASIAA